jgi:hypothetical protein
MWLGNNHPTKKRNWVTRMRVPRFITGPSLKHIFWAKIERSAEALQECHLLISFPSN